MSNCKNITIILYLIAIVCLVGTSYGQEHVSPDSLKLPPISSSLKTTAIPLFPYKSTDIVRNDTPHTRENLINNIAFVPTDLYITSKNFFSSGNTPMIGLMAGATSSFYSQDQGLFSAMHRLHSKSRRFRKATEFGVAIGDGKWQVAGAALMSACGYLMSDTKLVNTSFQITEAVVSTGIMVQLLKRSIGRESPAAYSAAGGKFHPFPSVKEYNHHQTRYYSFPSGHTATAVAVLTVISKNYPDVVWIKPVGYCAVACLGASLVTKEMHWYSDLPLAAMIGYSFGKTIASRTTENDVEIKTSERAIGISLLPTVSNHTKGVSLFLSF